MAAKGMSLHIGLNRVDPAHYDGWDGKLNACENDTSLYETLAKKNGFATKRLLNEEATASAVLKELQRICKELVSGDILLISYSGHGGSLPDLNADEDDAYRNDETWCLFDRQLVDDELFLCYSKFRSGVRILIFSDSCHSGTVSRFVRDSNEVEIDKDLQALYKKHKMLSRSMPAEKVAPVYKNNQALYDPILTRPVTKKDSVAAFVLLFGACQDNETAKEWGENGIFTGVIKKIADTSFTSYLKFFEEIKKNVPQRLQVPNMYTYGNASFDFSKQAPFFIGGKNVASAGNKKKQPAAEVNQDTGGTKLIVHTTHKNREYADTTLPGETGDGYYNIQEDAGTIAQAWDKAYEKYLSADRAGDNILFAEPDIRSKYARIPDMVSRGTENNYLNNWPPPDPGPNEFIWHLDDDHSQLRKACMKVTGNQLPFGVNFDDEKLNIKIGHIDTGYLDHLTRPLHLRTDLGVSYVKNELGINKGKDQLNTGFPAEQDGHGCATLAILAGNKITNAADSYTGYTDYFGAIPFADVIPIRICDTVYNFFNANDVAEGIDYAVDNGCEVITMSMAGYPTRRVADAVNRAYSKGVVMVTAAGNNWFKGIQKITPKAVMYPARFDRVIAATGACYNQLPYDMEANQWFLSRSDPGETMQGNWGPQTAMTTAVAGYTPNLPWATIRGADKFYRSGAGTSSATPQVAATVALWIVYNRDRIKSNGLEGNWKKVEAARKAIFRSASKSYADYKKYYGNGIIKAFDALENFDFNTEIPSLKESSPARVVFGGLFQFVGQWLRSRSSTDTGFAGDETLQEMLSLEIMQLVYRSVEDGGDAYLAKYADVLEFEKDDAADFMLDTTARKEFTDALKRSENASSFFKRNRKIIIHMAIHTMQKLETLSLTITAGDEFPDTKIAVTTGQEYAFTCDATQRWKDWYRKTGPNGFFNLFAWIAGLRVKGVKCICLCGAYNDDYTNKGFPIGTEKTVLITENGTLSFFANDAQGHYGNNEGAVVMNVTRLL